jgi:hypothetical protein
MWRVELQSGGAQPKLTKLNVDITLAGPDGLRPIGGNRFLQKGQWFSRRFQYRQTFNCRRWRLQHRLQQCFEDVASHRDIGDWQVGENLAEMAGRLGVRRWLTGWLVYHGQSEKGDQIMNS